MITNRTLAQWRRDALNGVQEKNYNKDCPGSPDPDTIVSLNYVLILNQRILRLTQELMDTNLMKGR